MNIKSVTILGVFLIITCAILFHFTIEAKDTETHAIPYPVNNFSTDTAYPVLTLFHGGTVRIDFKGVPTKLSMLGVQGDGRSTDMDAELAFLERLLHGESVYLRFEADIGGGENGDILSNSYHPDGTQTTHRRLHVYLYRAPDGLFVNLELIRQGFRKVATKKTFKHMNVFQHYEKYAESLKKGIWEVPSEGSKTIQVETLWD